MIVETGSLTTVGVGAAKVQPEQGDSVMRLPNIILPVIELIEPTTINPDTNVPQSVSFIRNLFVNRNNQAATGINFIQLAKGYWRLNFQQSLRISFAAPIAFNTNGFLVNMISPIGGVSNVIIAQNPDQTGYHRAETSFKILLRENANVTISVPLTGAADFIDLNLTCQAERLL